MILRILALFTVVALAPTAAPAQSAGAPEQELARLLVTHDMWSQNLDRVGANMRTRLEGHPGRKLEYPADLQKRIRDELEAALPYEDLVGMHSKQLASSYTAAELKEIVAFHKTPAGKKWLQVQPAASDAVATQTQQRMQQKVPEIMTRMSKLAKAPAGSPAAGSPHAKSPHGADPHGMSGMPPHGKAADATATKASPEKKPAAKKPSPAKKSASTEKPASTGKPASTEKPAAAAPPPSADPQPAAPPKTTP